MTCCSTLPRAVTQNRMSRIPMRMVAMAPPARQEGDGTVDEIQGRGDEGFMKSIPFIDMSAEPSSRLAIPSALFAADRTSAPGQEDEDRQQVEKVVHGGGGEGAAKLASVPDVPQGRRWCW